jgi:hypothetical protein
MKGNISAIVAGLAMMLSGHGIAQASTAPPPLDSGEVVVHGYPPHCHPRPGDPQDAVDLTPAAGGKLQQVIRIDPATGRYGLFEDDYPVTGSDIWQRDGTGIDQFVFRVPASDDPVCIGARSPRAKGFAQLRRSFMARPYWGKFVRLTAFVATRKARDVRFWVAAGAGNYVQGHHVKVGANIVAGGFQSNPFRGNQEWRPLSLTVGPLPCMATQISYGVMLNGGGDVWFYQAKFEEVPNNEIPASLRRLPHGAALLKADPVCRHFLNGEPLYLQHDKKMVEIKDDNLITPPNIIYVRSGIKELGGRNIKGGQSFAPVDYRQTLALGVF